MRSIVVSGKTIEDCIRQAKRELSARREDLDIEVIEEPRKGFLGIGAKDGVIRASLKDDIVQREDHDFVKSILYSQASDDLFSSDIKEEKSEEKIDEKDKGNLLDFSNDDDLDLDFKEIQSETESFGHVKEIPILKNHLEIDPKIFDQEVSQSVKSDQALIEEIDQEDLGEREKFEITEENTEVSQALKEEKADKNFEITKDSDIYIAAKEILTKILEDMHIKAYTESRVEGTTIKFNMICEEEADIGILIGKRGETLDSLQFLVNLVANRNSKTHIRVILDINDYRSKREKSLKKLARNLALKAKKTNREVKLEPMNAYERKIIHTELQNDRDIYTFSQGDEPHRRVVIRKKQDK